MITRAAVSSGRSLLAISAPTKLERVGASVPGAASAAQHQHMDIAADLRGGGHGAAGRLADGAFAAVGENEDSHAQITFASLRSLSTSSATEAALRPAWRFGGSSTFSTVRRGVTSTPRSAGFSVSIGFLRAFLMFGRLRSLGSPSYDVMAVGDHDHNFHLWAAMVGLGIAQAQPERRVVVVTGDGEQLMGFGALATIALRKPRNLSIVILDNGHFGETGMQPSHAGQGLEFTRVAEAIGFPKVDLITERQGVEPLRRRVHARDGLNLAVVKIKPENLPRALPPRDGVYVKNRFRLALGFAPA
jgi:hypothetical protein